MSKLVAQLVAKSANNKLAASQMIRLQALHERGRLKICNILLQPYQCGQRRKINSLRQPVRGSELFRMIQSSDIPELFWLPGAYPSQVFVLFFPTTDDNLGVLNSAVRHVYVRGWVGVGGCPAEGGVRNPAGSGGGRLECFHFR